jgi:hypothetical protein
MRLHLLRLLVELEPHYTYGSKDEDNKREDAHNPRPDSTAFTMEMLMRVRL